jgi:hypothetical protein
VFGVEAQGEWANLKGSNTSTTGTFGGLPFSNQTKIDAIGLFTGQVGYAWNDGVPLVPPLVPQLQRVSRSRLELKHGSL